MNVPSTTTALVVGVLVTLVMALLLTGVPTNLPAGRDPGDGGSDRAPIEYRTVVVFRNDDLEPGHREDLRRTVGQLFIDENVPLTNAVIPTKDGDSIATNETFCRDLRRQRRAHPNLVEHSLHGYLHESRSVTLSGANGEELEVESEFGGLAYETQRERIAEGTRILAECLGTPPTAFVPPYGTYDDATIRALAAENVSILSDSDWFTSDYYGETDPFETRGVLHVSEDHGFVSDWNTGDFHEQSTLRERFDAAYRAGELYVHVLHYWTFDDADRRDQLRSFLDYVKRHDGVLFMTVSQFAEAYRDGRLTRTDDEWSYIPPEDGNRTIYGTEPLNGTGANLPDGSDGASTADDTASGR